MLPRCLPRVPLPPSLSLSLSLPRAARASPCAPARAALASVTPSTSPSATTEPSETAKSAEPTAGRGSSISPSTSTSDAEGLSIGPSRRVKPPKLEILVKYPHRKIFLVDGTSVRVPRRPTTAHKLFIKERHKVLKAEREAAGPSDSSDPLPPVLQQLCAEWHSLSESDKDVYREKAAVIAALHAEALANFEERHPGLNANRLLLKGGVARLYDGQNDIPRNAEDMKKYKESLDPRLARVRRPTARRASRWVQFVIDYFNVAQSDVPKPTLMGIELTRAAKVAPSFADAATIWNSLTEEQRKSYKIQTVPENSVVGSQIIRNSVAGQQLPSNGEISRENSAQQEN